jgi:hypothetical protein
MAILFFLDQRQLLYGQRAVVDNSHPNRLQTVVLFQRQLLSLGLLFGG